MSGWYTSRTGDFAEAFASTASDFLDTAVDEIVVVLAGKAGVDGLDVSPQQVSAWSKGIRIVGEALARLISDVPDRAAWGVIFEYSLPRRATRPDVVLLVGDVVVVLELKIGESRFPRADVLQAEDYAHDLTEFHEASRGLQVLPALLCSSAGSDDLDLKLGFTERRVQLLSSPSALVELLEAVEAHAGKKQLDVFDWDSSRYVPSPDILQSALEVYAGNDIREISHSGAENLTSTVDAIRSVVSRAQSEGERWLCFVTGVPGSGKTLAGLTAVHTMADGVAGKALGVYLSGNGPLVDVLRYALARDSVSRGVATTSEARRLASVRVQPVHRFIEELATSDHEPPEHVLVFDEAQRAWDQQRMRSKQQLDCSEATATLQVMGRKQGWSVVVALVGEGQEINAGEAGLAPWLDAAGELGWHVAGPPRLGVSHEVELAELHLSVGVRTPRARSHAEWVDALLEGDFQKAAQIRQSPDVLPVFLTRSQEVMRSHLRDRATLDRRTGLLASAQARRLRSFGIEMSGAFQGDVDWPRWFVEPETDIRSSYHLEVAASEFKCQGLELDWTGLCWGQDFTWGQGAWHSRKMSGSRWNEQSNPERAVNRYRVLLTRARYGMVIWVPEGRDVPLVDFKRLDSVAEVLATAGATTLDA